MICFLDFQKLGGFMVIESGLLSPYNTVKCKTADLIGVLVQNNPYCQNKFIEYPTYINLLMKLVETDLDNKVCVKALHAISCECLLLSYIHLEFLFNSL